jgi:hypothetical protein
LTRQEWCYYHGTTFLLPMRVSQWPPNAIMFTYLSFPKAACAQTLPPGFYTVELYRDPAIREPKARLVNIETQTAAILPIIVEEMKARPDDEGKDEVGATLHSTVGPDGVRRVSVGVCRCQYIFPFSWRRLHIVIVITERTCSAPGMAHHE